MEVSGGRLIKSMMQARAGESGSGTLSGLLPLEQFQGKPRETHKPSYAVSTPTNPSLYAFSVEELRCHGHMTAGWPELVLGESKVCNHQRQCFSECPAKQDRQYTMSIFTLFG
eukprot:828035-Pelagomonas_calceolata.AAC.3